MKTPLEQRVEAEPGNANRSKPFPVVHYWEVLWNRLHQEGWKLTHTTWCSPESGGIRHYVSARRGGEWLEHSAPSMTESMAKIAQAALETDRANAAQAFRAEHAAPEPN